MGDLDALYAERQQVQDAGNTLLDSIEENDKGQKVPDVEQGKTLRGYAEKLKSLDEQIVEAQSDQGAIDTLRAKVEVPPPAGKQEMPPIYGKTPDPTQRQEQYLTAGEQFVASDAYRSFIAQFPDQKRVPNNWQGDATVLRNGIRPMLGLRTPTEAARMRELVTSVDASAGTLVRPDWRGLLEPGLWTPTGIVNILTVIPVSTDTIQYVKELSHVDAATTVEEATALTGTSGIKPEGGVTFDVVTDTVSTIAVWVPATKRILADANGLAAYLNQYLQNDVKRELEDQIINGDGNNDNFTGLLNAGIGTQAAGDGPFYAIRLAKADIRTNARTTPTAIVANPTNVAEWDLAEVNSETNRFVGAPSAPFNGGVNTIWGMRVVESEFVPEGHAIVGDFRYAVLYDRESTTLSVGTVDDDFIRNIVRVLAELRAGFGVIRPAAFEDVTV